MQVSRVHSGIEVPHAQPSETADDDTELSFFDVEDVEQVLG